MKSKPIQTDQTECYDESGKIISCAGAGQDATHRAGLVWPHPRFVENADTVTDMLTGLIWPQNAGLFEFPLSFDEALEAIEQMNTARMLGFSDWRLPQRDELFSLVSHANINPALPAGNPFSDVFPGYYWTATQCARLPRQAWYVHLGGGRVFKGMKSGSYMVWPVRSNSGHDESGPETGKLKEQTPDRFLADQHGICDQRTGLMWTKDADIGARPVKWTESLKLVDEINRSREYGYPDWRLPNIRELESITDMTRHSPAIAASEIFNNIQSFYWSSTTSVYDPTYAWTLYTEDGNLGVGYKSNPEFHVWCVRNA